MQDIRAQFPLLQTYPELIYLDNAATTQKPASVLAAMHDYYTTANANVHRGSYPLAELATEKYENARKTVARFLEADTEEIIFTGGTTDGLNLLATMLAKANFLPEKPTVLLGDAEHHANILPWQTHDFELSYVPLDEDYNYGFSEITIHPDIVSLSLVSNVTGSILDVKAVRQKFPKSILVLDAAQAVAHIPVNVAELGCDFLAFSGHKLYGPTGIGVLYGKRSLLEKLNPARVGGGMITKVERDTARWSELPAKFEAGTPPIAEALGLAAAIDFINSIGWETLQAQESIVNKALHQMLQTIPGLQLYHAKGHHSGVFSFSIDGTHAHDIAYLLGEQNVAARAGHHCTQILHRETLHTPATTRLSTAIYNTLEEVEKVRIALEGAIEKVEFYAKH